MKQAKRHMDLNVQGDLVTSNPLSFRNLLINGNFDIWQRGGSLGPFTADAYVADRWRITKNDTVNFNVDLGQFSIGQTDVPNSPRYFHRLRLNSIGSGVEFVSTSQRIEDVTRTSGQTLTLSFWARADQALTINPAVGTNHGAITINQNFGTSGTPSAAVNTIVQQSQAVTTTWTKYTYTFTVPSVSGKTLGTDANSSFLQISIFPLVAGNAGRQIDIAQVQLEVGSSATPFERRPYGMELQLCQRYYETGNFSWIGCFTGANVARIMVFLKATKRIAPNPVTVTKTFSDSTLTGVTPYSVFADVDRLNIQFTSTGASGNAEMTGFWTASAEL